MSTRGDTRAGEAVAALGHYSLLGEIASGGIATVHLGRLTSAAGFSRIVAIKRLQPAFAQDAQFVDMLVDEARLGARIRHPNVVATLDVVLREGETLLVLEYVHGEALSTLLKLASAKNELVPIPVAVALLVGTLRGLHAAHETRDESGAHLEIVHRDLSPQNILVGLDGLPRVADFGIAKARGRLSKTESGVLKGKAAYMAPEQVHGEASARTDVFAMSVVGWEICAGQRLFKGATMNEVLGGVIAGKIRPLTEARDEVPAPLAAVIHRGLERDPAKRWPSAEDMADALEKAVPAASPAEVGAWVKSLAGDRLAAREGLLLAKPERGAESIPPGMLLTETLTMPQPVPARPKRRMIALALLGSSIALGAVALYQARRSDEAVRPQPIAATSIAAEPATDAAPAPASAEPVAPPASAASAPSVPSEAASPSSASAAVPTRKPARHAPATPGARCSPPYVIDANGHVKYKRECFQQ